MSTALVLSGGGAKGAFQVGVLQRLYAQGVKFDAMYGSSVGALNSAGLSWSGIDKLTGVWLGIRSRRDILKFQWNSLLLRTGGIFSTAPLKKLIEDVVKPSVEPSCPVVVSVVSHFDSKIYYIRSDDYHTHYVEPFSEAVLASASMPMVMEPVEKYFVDGGVRDVAPLKPAVHDRHDTIYIIHTGRLSPVASYQSPRTWIEHALRVWEIRSHELVVNDIRTCLSRNNHEHYRKIKLIIYAPEVDGLINTIDFKPEKIRRAIAHGRDAEPKYSLPF